VGENSPGKPLLLCLAYICKNAIYVIKKTMNNALLTLSHTNWMQGARAQRVEYLLLHSFHAKKFIVPDKFARNKEVNTGKRKMNADTEGANAADGVADPSNDDEVHHGDQGKARKGPSYAGGLVLEPKKGLYDKYILLLDFNSLYPSIIQVIAPFHRFCKFRPIRS
jgi:DNA polymerase elongation subunit (family B)